jgi:RNA polymerase sigma factor (sigma-70 family)
MPGMFRSRAATSQQDAPAPADEAELIACAVRDPAAFAPLYHRYLDPVFRYCFRRLGSREVAEDATSLIFERVLKALPTYRGGLFRAWLFAIAHNVINDSYRSIRIHDQHEPIDAAAGLADPGPLPEAVAVLADEQRLLLAMLPLLPADQRRVMELRLSGLPSTEVAVVLGRTPESVRTLQLRAIRRLQTLLDVPTPGSSREAHHG